VTHCQVRYVKSRPPNPNAKLSVKTPDAIGNVLNPNALNPSANLCAKILIVNLKSPVALVKEQVLEIHPHISSKKQNKTQPVANADNDFINYDYKYPFPYRIYSNL
jgi:hypothetical protein